MTAPDFTGAVARLVAGPRPPTHADLTRAIREAAPGWAAIALRDPRLMQARARRETIEALDALTPSSRTDRRHG